MAVIFLLQPEARRHRPDRAGAAELISAPVKKVWQIAACETDVPQLGIRHRRQLAQRAGALAHVRERLDETGERPQWRGLRKPRPVGMSDSSHG